MRRNADRPIVVFSHVPKAAGTTLIHLLRRHFGLRHLDVGRRAIIWEGPRVMPYLYGPRDLRADLRVFPRLRSIAGHFLQPFVPFEEFEGRLRWYLLLREPLARFRSQYLHEVEVNQRHLDIRTWLTTFERDNMMVRHVAGARDLKAAREILAERVSAIGLQERFEESLVMLRAILGLEGFNLAYGAAQNAAVGRSPIPAWRERAREELERHADAVREANRLDTALYEWVLGELWPRQLASCGGAEFVRQEVSRAFGSGDPTLRERWHLACSFVARNAVYKPWLAAERARAGRGRTQGGEARG